MQAAKGAEGSEASTPDLFEPIYEAAAFCRYDTSSKLERTEKLWRGRDVTTSPFLKSLAYLSKKIAENSLDLSFDEMHQLEEKLNKIEIYSSADGEKESFTADAVRQTLGILLPLALLKALSSGFEEMAKSYIASLSTFYSESSLFDDTLYSKLAELYTKMAPFFEQSKYPHAKEYFKEYACRLAWGKAFQDRDPSEKRAEKPKDMNLISELYLLPEFECLITKHKVPMSAAFMGRPSEQSFEVMLRKECYADSAQKNFPVSLHKFLTLLYSANGDAPIKQCLDFLEQAKWLDRP